MSEIKVQPRPGTPLYASVRDAVRAAIERGRFQPGERLPSTEDLAERVGVSLVTMHRALRDLVAEGVVRRGHGRGTFVHEDFVRGRAASRGLRIGLTLPEEARLSDTVYGAYVDGARAEAARLEVDLTPLRGGEDRRSECDGILMIAPRAGEAEKPAGRAGSGGSRSEGAVMVLGGRSPRGSAWVDVDHAAIGRGAAGVLADAGHRRVGFVGGSGVTGGDQERWTGFVEGCVVRGLECPRTHVFRTETLAWAVERLAASMREAGGVGGVGGEGGGGGVSAYFAANWRAALAVYEAAKRAGVRIPEDVSVVGAEDAPSAEFLAPPLTTYRVPAEAMGELALRDMVDMIARSERNPPQTLMNAELVTRGSVAMRAMT